MNEDKKPEPDFEAIAKELGDNYERAMDQDHVDEIKHKKNLALNVNQARQNLGRELVPEFFRNRKIIQLETEYQRQYKQIEADHKRARALIQSRYKRQMDKLAAEIKDYKKLTEFTDEALEKDFRKNILRKTGKSDAQINQELDEKERNYFEGKKK